MTAREELTRATARLEEIAGRISSAAGRPAPEVEELARQAFEISAAVVEIIPRAIAEAEEAARGEARAGERVVPDGLPEDQPA